MAFALGIKAGGTSKRVRIFGALNDEPFGTAWHRLGKQAVVVGWLGNGLQALHGSLAFAFSFFVIIHGVQVNDIRML